MKKVYNGNCMALPKEDVELFRQINAKTAQRRLDWERAQNEPVEIYSDAEPEEVRERPDLKKAAGVLTRALVGCVFLGAVVRCWCAAEFGACCAAACGIWAVQRWWRKGNG